MAYLYAYITRLCSVCCAKAAEEVEVLFKVENLVDPTHIVLDEGFVSLTTRRFDEVFAKLLLVSC